MKLLTKEQQELYENAKSRLFFKKKFKNKSLKIKLKKIVKLEIIVIIQEKIEVLHIAYVI